MSLRSNFKFHECDKIVVFRQVYAIASKIAASYDLLEDGRPKIFLESDKGEKYSSDGVAPYIVDVAYHSREAMVRTCLDVCRCLSNPSEETKLLVNGCYFLEVATCDVWKNLFHFPENPDFDGYLEEIPQRPQTFYDSSFWSSSIVQSWLIVHTVYAWFELRMRRWASETAEKIVNGQLF